MDIFDVVTVGNAKIDIFLQVHDTNEHFRFNRETQELCVKAGDKARVDKAIFTVGGNAANVSVGIARMGLRTAVVAEIGADEFADKITNTLGRENVSEKYLKKTAGETSFSIIINFAGERTIFEEEIERDHDYNFDNISTGWVYLTSLGEKWRDAYQKTLDFVTKNNLRLAFNPGTTQLDSGGDAIEAVFHKTEILFLAKEEALKILRPDIDLVESGESGVKRLLNLLREKGPKVVVITDGRNGSFMLDQNNNYYSNGIIESDVREKTGAGDAYASGFLSAIILGKDYQTAMRWGTANSASVIGKIGAQAGLLNREEMEKYSYV